jgi:hypothetical protein
MIALFFGVLTFVLFIGREELAEILTSFWRAGK